MRKRLLILFLAFVCPQASGQELQDDPKTAAGVNLLQDLPLGLSQRARIGDAIKTRNFREAEKLLLEEIEKTPSSPQLLTFVANVLFLDREYLNTAIALKKAEALAPLSDRDRFLLAMAYVTLDRRAWARPELEKLANANPRHPLYPYWLARLDYDDQHFSSAVAHLQKVLELDPAYMKAYDNLGLCYDALGKHEEAYKSYQEANRLNRQKSPSSPWPPLNQASLLLKLGKLEEAEASLKESLKYQPKFPQAHYHLGMLLEKQKKFPEAVQELKQATEADPSYPEPHYALGRIYRSLGDIQNSEVALSTFEKLKKEKRPDHRR